MLRRLSVIAFGICIMFGIVACDSVEQPGAAMHIVRQPVENGDVDQGRQLIAAYGCGSCHTIPGIRGANAHVGPPLTDWSQRQYIAGNLPNTPENLSAWIMNPQAIEPGTAMPVLGVTEEEVVHISAYLYTLGN